ncbi:MAG: GTPase [Vicinamibacterales bacterium]
MFSTADTIVAIATPPGRGGLGVVRLSGPAALSTALALVGRGEPLEPRRATFVRLVPRGPILGDEVVVTSFPAPASYTGEDVVEISAHGSPVVLAGILQGAIAGGARLAEPGEFTLRAFLHGKKDLVQAEAVADLIDAVTPLQARAAFHQLEGTLTADLGAIEGALFDLVARLEASLDFPEEGFHFIEPAEVSAALAGLRVRVERLLEDASRGRIVREGALVALAGSPNVGKSSLFNALLQANRAIVSARSRDHARSAHRADGTARAVARAG